MVRETTPRPRIIQKGTRKAPGTTESQRASSREPMVPYPSIALKDGKVWEKGKDGGQDTVIAPRIQVLEVCIDRETREHWMLVGFEALDGSAQLRLNRGDLNRRGLLVYQKYGFPVTETNATKIIYHLLNEEIRAPRVYIHRSLGWTEHDAELVFHHHIAYGLRLPSRYEGELAIQPGGTAEGWIQAIRAYVLGRSPLELALCCGLSACVVGLIGILVGCPSLVTHAYGDSSMGKTTAAMLVVSPFGPPDPLARGLHASWNSTDNALLSRLVGNRGVPVAFDESSTDPSRDFTALIYRLASGTDKDRLNRESELKDRGKWSTTIFSTGEASLLGQATRNTGLRMRLLEFGNVEWTDSASHADALRAAILAHHGHAGPRFANFLRKLGRDKVLATFWEVHSEALKRLADIGIEDALAHRGAVKAAIIMTTARFVPVALDLSLDLEGLWNLLLQAEQVSASERNLPQQAYVYFQEQLARYRSRFEWHTSHGRDLVVDVPNSGVELWGRVTKRGSSVEVAILPTKFQELLREGGFTNSDVVLHAWKKDHLLDHEGGRLTRQRTLAGTRQRMYVIRLPEATAGEEAKQTTPATRPRKVIRLKRKQAEPDLTRELDL